MDKERFDRYAKALESEGAMQPCPRCGNRQFQIVGESSITLQTDPNVIQLGGPGIPAVIVGCSKCGCLFEHAINLLLKRQPKEVGNG